MNNDPLPRLRRRMSRSAALALAALVLLAAGCNSSTDPLSAGQDAPRILAKSPNGAPPSGHTDYDPDWPFPWEPSVVDSVTPSTNYQNMLADQFHFDVLEVTRDSITIEFHSGPGFGGLKPTIRCYEVRFDGEGLDPTGEHPNPLVKDRFYAGGCSMIFGFGTDPVVSQKTYGAESHIDIRYAHDFRLPKDNYFSWTRVYVLKPREIGDCKQGGWEQYGFRNQGQCVRYVNTGFDSRPDADS